MKDTIIQKLSEIEEINQVKILYAVDAGSRGWGLESPDSDFDIRFIYIHKPQWYLSIRDKRDVIELPINDLLDIGGWDIRKTLALLTKSNPTLLEWLNSPIVYKKSTEFIDRLRELLSEYFSPKSCTYHYLHMAQKNYRGNLKGDIVNIKDYLYVLRPIMACMYIEKFNTQPPMVFQELMNSINLNDNLTNEINTLIIDKKKGKDTRGERSIKIINKFIEDKIEYFKEQVRYMEDRKNNDIDVLDKLFRKTLKESWG